MKKIALSSVLAALVLSACGGGGSNDGGKAADNAVVPQGNFDAQGMYSGTDSNNDTVTVVLDNGTLHYFVYVNPGDQCARCRAGNGNQRPMVRSVPLDATDLS